MKPGVWPLPPKFPKYFIPILVLSCYLYYNYLCVINMHLSLLNKLLHSWYLHLLPGVMYIINVTIYWELTMHDHWADHFSHIISRDPHGISSGIYYHSLSEDKVKWLRITSWLGAELDMEPKLTLNHYMVLHGIDCHLNMYYTQILIYWVKLIMTLLKSIVLCLLHGFNTLVTVFCNL